MAKYLSNIDLNKNELQNPVIHPLGTAPGTPVEGQIYYDSTTGDKHIYLYNGTAWIQLSEGTHTTDYVSNVSLSGTDLTFTGIGNAFNGTVDLSSLDEIVNDSTITINAGVSLTTGGSFTLNQASNATITIDHDATSRTDTTSTDAPSYGGTFEAVTSVTTNETGHVTAIDVSTVTLPASIDNYVDSVGFNTSTGVLTLGRTGALADLTEDLDGRYLTGNETITLTGEVTGSGTTSISTTVANNVLDVANFNASAIVIETEGIENNDNDTTLPTSAAVKAYVDAATVGGLIYQGGYDANLNSPDLTTSPNSILKGWTYTVTADGTFFGEQLRVGDVLIAEVDDPSALTDWTTVQNNIDLASASQVGIGNVVVSTAASLRGLSVAYSNGTATAGLKIYGLTDGSSSVDPGGASLVVFNQPDNTNYKIKINDIAPFISAANTYATTITDTATITHSLGTKDVIIQLYDVTTDETVYADVERASTNTATITFATTPTNSIRVLVQKIG